MSIVARDKKTAPLGSGITYIAEVDGNFPATAAALIALCTEENQIGTTIGGATLTYTVNVHAEKDDLGTVLRQLAQDEEVKLKTGIFSWAPSALQKLSSTYQKTTENGYIIHDIGGLEHDDGKSYIVIFKHIDKKYGNLYLCILGKNTAGLTMAFVKDKVTELGPEFTAEPLNDSGTLVRIIEELPNAVAPTQANVEDSDG